MLRFRIGKVLYRSLGHILPREMGKRFRAYTAKLMFRCSEGVVLEKHIKASENLTIGKYSGIGENAYI